MKDYYEILEVNKNASDDTIKKVFRMLIKKNHPDLFEEDEKVKAEAKVKDLNEAYKVLSNKESREKYNLELEEYNNKNDDALIVLMEENEYLKNVIEEKNKIINEFIQDVNETSDNLHETIIDTNKIDSENMEKGYYKYKREEQLKRKVYIFAIVISVMIVLWRVMGINMIKIIIDAIRNMF